MSADTLPVNILAGRPEPGHNRPPLEELLAEELTPLRERAHDLLDAAGHARIETPADAGAVADLIVLLREHERIIDRARAERKKPLLADCRKIDAAFGALIAPMARARLGDQDSIGLVETLGRWQAANGDAPVHAQVASISRRRELSFVIEDIPAALGWLLDNRPGELLQAMRTIIGTAIRAAGVDAIERGEITIPGVALSIAAKAHIR